MNYKDIKLVVCDLDGTLTDGMYHISTPHDGFCEGQAMVTKSFNTKDFYGLQQLQSRGISVLILTGADDNVIYAKVKGLPAYCKTDLTVASGIENKLAYMEEYIKAFGFGWENVAYIGDAGNDLECMKKAAITACPSDAVSIIKNEANIVSDLPGGRGAVGEFADYIIQRL